MHRPERKAWLFPHMLFTFYLRQNSILTSSSSDSQRCTEKCGTRGVHFRLAAPYRCGSSRFYSQARSSASSCGSSEYTCDSSFARGQTGEAYMPFPPLTQLPWSLHSLASQINVNCPTGSLSADANVDQPVCPIRLIALSLVVRAMYVTVHGLSCCVF
ncbi:hypothetical protein BD626DRAFT_473616 [Schizophyllum amplum]|uniref:Uncharacterized protein n=1 Tax=Schizophyllum amplum TaxID=97359 RepID=A0A550CWY5_9AGAR|nr:hypothetical protein BD626DRAFT_473616 [Auriculariopsis ampla]